MSDTRPTAAGDTALLCIACPDHYPDGAYRVARVEEVSPSGVVTRVTFSDQCAPVDMHRITGLGARYYTAAEMVNGEALLCYDRALEAGHGRRWTDAPTAYVALRRFSPSTRLPVEPPARRGLWNRGGVRPSYLVAYTGTDSGTVPVFATPADDYATAVAVARGAKLRVEAGAVRAEGVVLREVG